MATIDNLVTSLTEMSEEELFLFIRKLRENRRNSLLSTPQKKTSKSKPSTPLSADSLLNKLSESDKNNLLKILEGKL